MSFQGWYDRFSRALVSQNSDFSEFYDTIPAEHAEDAGRFPVGIITALVYRMKKLTPFFDDSRLIPVSTWLIKDYNVSPQELKKCALSGQLFQLATYIGATDQEVMRAKQDMEVYHFFRECLTYTPTPAKVIQRVMAYLQNLHDYDFAYECVYKNVLEMVVDHVSDDKVGWEPVIRFLIQQGGLDPRQGQNEGLDTALSFAGPHGNELRDYMMKLFSHTQGSRLSGKLAVRQGRFERGEFAPGKETRKIPRDLVRRIIFQAAAYEVVATCDDTLVPPAQLIGLARILRVSFNHTTTWSQLCKKVQEGIQEMLL